MAVFQSSLVVELDGEFVRSLPLSFSLLRIGRAPDNELALQDPGVSRYHAELRLGDQGLTVTDLSSANGTFVNDERLLPHRPVPLEPGSVLRIGPFVLLERRDDSQQDAHNHPITQERPRARTRRRATPAAPLVYGETTRHFMAGRPTYPVNLPVDRVSRYLKYLPSMFMEPDEKVKQRDRDFLGRFLLILESIWEPLEQRQDHMEMYFSPKTCPPPFLYWLAGWFDLAVGAHWPEGRIRDLLRRAHDLYRWRGTRDGMTQMIEIWTGLTPEIEESPTQPFVFNVRLYAPDDTQINSELIEDLLRAHKPAHAGFVLEIVR